MEEADELCDRLAIIDHGQLLALGTPAELKRSIGADTVVTVIGRPATSTRSAKVLEAEVPGAQQATRVDTHRASSRCGRSSGVLPAGVQRRRAPRLRGHRPLRHRAHARDRLHQPHREGPARMTAATIPDAPDHAGADPQAGGRDARRVPRAAPARPRRAAQDAQGVHPPHDPAAVPAGVRVHLRVPEDRPGRRRQRRGEPSSRRCSSPASSASRSCSRASSRSSLPMVQEFGYTREIEDRVLAPMPVCAGRDREGDLGRAERPVLARCSCSRSRRSCRRRRCTSTSTGWCCSRSRRSPATCAARSGSRSAPGSTRARCRCCSASSCIPLTFLGCVYYSWSSLEPIRWLQIARARQPARLHVRGLPRRAHQRRRT